MSTHNLPKPKNIPQTIRSERHQMRSYLETVVFKNVKRVNKGSLGNCFGSGFNLDNFPEFLRIYEEKHREIVQNTIALCIIGDEGRGYMKFNLVYSTSKYQMNAKYSIMLLIAELKESTAAINAILEKLPLKAIRDRANQLKIPLLFSGNFKL